MSTTYDTDRCTDTETTRDFGDLRAYVVDPAPPAPNAAVCGALGCRSDDDLRRAEHPDHGERVVCPEHLAELRDLEDDG
jgi:hypothetical protein